MHTVAKPLFLAGGPSFKFVVLLVVVTLTPMPIFILVSMPALFVFWMLLRRFEYGISLSSAFVWYLFGHSILFLLLLLFGTLKIGVEGSIGILTGLELTVGFALLLLLRKNKPKRKPVSKNYSGWEGYQ